MQTAAMRVRRHVPAAERPTGRLSKAIVFQKRRVRDFAWTNPAGCPAVNQPQLWASSLRWLAEQVLSGRRHGQSNDRLLEQRVDPEVMWRQYGALPSVQIKDVPPETHSVLRQRAAAAH